MWFVILISLVLLLFDNLGHYEEIPIEEVHTVE